ncbi:MAG: cell division protein SepF [Actinomycetota bacterium]|nr:cell division protein SepF [Actinomycetota bacterium]
MSGIFRRTMAYFGLVEDDEYDEFDDMGLDEEYSYEDPYLSRSVKRVERSMPDYQPSEPIRAQEPPPLRTIGPPQPRVHIVEPKSFNDAQNISDRFKASIPVIINLQFLDQETSKRLIDFASGLTYGLDGGIQKVADRVFLITPANVQVSAEEHRRLREKGLYNQSNGLI